MREGRLTTRRLELLINLAKESGSKCIIHTTEPTEKVLECERYDGFFISFLPLNLMLTDKRDRSRNFLLATLMQSKFI